MGYRAFTDRDGHQWEIRDRSDREWEFQPLGANPHARRLVRRPGYESDPFELSKEELQRLLDEASGGGAPPRKSPFRD